MLSHPECVWGADSMCSYLFLAGSGKRWHLSGALEKHESSVAHYVVEGTWEESQINSSSCAGSATFRY